MAIKNFFKKMFTGEESKHMQQTRFLDGRSPIFTQFGNNIFASDVVQMCVGAIATECSKLRPKHIRTDPNGMQSIVNSSINRLFKFGPNELMTTRDFIEKVIRLLYKNYNAFIYPKYEIRLDNNGRQIKEYTGFYPLNPTIVTFVQDSTDTLFVEMSFANGEKFTLRYSDVIHLRKDFGSNDIMGGGENGQPDHQALLKVLRINDTVLQGLEKAIKTSMQVRGVLKINTMLDDDGQKEERKKFEAKMAAGESGIIPMDIKGDYQDIKADPKLIDKDTLEFLDRKVLHHYGVSFPIISGDFTDDQYQAFYEKTLEPIVIALGQAFSKTVFTQRELEFGNEIVFYQRDMMYLSTKAKLELLKTAGEQGLLTDNQKLAIIGYPPIEGGEKRTMSLNYIDVELANIYQMSKKGGNKSDE